MSKLRYILFVLFSAITFNVFSCRDPHAEMIDNVIFSYPSFKIKMDKSRGDFYVAVLDSTALLSKNDFPNLKILVDSANQAYNEYLDELLPGDSVYYRRDLEDSLRYAGRAAEFKDSVFASAYYRLYTHVANNFKSVKCSDPNLYKYFAGSNPLTWQKSNDGVVLFQDSLYAGAHNSYNSKVRLVVYCPSEDWYYISPLIDDYGKSVLRVPENKGTDWNISCCDFHQDSIGISLFLTLIVLLLAYMVSKLMSKLLKLYSPSSFKVIFPVLAVPLAFSSFLICRLWHDAGSGYLVLGFIFLFLVLGIPQIIIFCFLKYPELDSIGDKVIRRINKFLSFSGLVLSVNILTICIGIWIINFVGPIVVNFLQFLMWR